MTETHNPVLVIPDVHGRTFWKHAVELYPDADTIFLGDYLDPYPRENITPEDTLANFREILNHGRNHPNCHLLLCNHDLHYLCNFGEACRLDYANSAQIHFLLMENLFLFSLMTLREINGKKVVFSHAPILNGWIDTVKETSNVTLLERRMNTMLLRVTNRPWEVEDYLGQISIYRGGYDYFGSPVWADIAEVGDNLIPSADYSIFGHTQQKGSPVINDKWACLDCRQAFLVNTDLSISAII